MQSGISNVNILGTIFYGMHWAGAAGGAVSAPGTQNFQVYITYFQHQYLASVRYKTN